MRKVLFYLLMLQLLGFFLIQCTKADLMPELTGEWNPPIGIPRPSFGIEENYRMYDDELKRSIDLEYHQNDEGGFYTHYVDNTAPNATDNDNRYGSKDLPRMSWPDDKSILPGSVLEIHGGPYTVESLTYKANGTSELPVFIRGYSTSNRVKLIAGIMYLNFQYVIFENFEKTQSGLMVRTFENNEAHHVGVRNCEVHDFNNVNHGISAVCWINGKSANNIVIYNNIIHPDNFDPSGGEFPQNDILGVYLTMNTNNIWVVDNDIYNASGDAVGGGHGSNYTTKSYYIGRNRMHTCGENAIDLKEVENIVVSQNIMYNFQGWSTGDQGGATVVHEGPIYSPKNVWFLYNEIYDCSDAAIFVGGEKEYVVYYIGNIIHDISNAKGTGRAYRTWSSKKVYFVNNTIYRCDNGVDSRVDGPDVEFYMFNNIISNIKDGGFHLLIGGPQQIANTQVKNNLFYQNGANLTFQYGSSVYQNLSDFYAATTLGEPNFVGDPAFMNPEANDFRLLGNSAAIDKGIDAGLNDRFSSFFGENINFDFSGYVRPQNGLWDIGAHEFK